MIAEQTSFTSPLSSALSRICWARSIYHSMLTFLYRKEIVQPSSMLCLTVNLKHFRRCIDTCRTKRLTASSCRIDRRYIHLDWTIFSGLLGIVQLLVMLDPRSNDLVSMLDFDILEPSCQKSNCWHWYHGSLHFSWLLDCIHKNLDRVLLLLFLSQLRLLELEHR